MPDARLTLDPDLRAGAAGAKDGSVTAFSADLFDAPDGSIQMQMLRGDTFRIHAERPDWLYGEVLDPVSGRRDYVGWVERDAVGPAVTPTHTITALRAPIFRAPDIKSRRVGEVPIAGRVAGHVDGDFLVTVSGHIHTRHLADPTGDWIDQATRFLGLPYVWGGMGPNGMDCSGLVKLALRLVGTSAPRDTDQQVMMGKAATRPHRRGDLVFWPGHVGILEDAQILLHANAHHMCVARDPLPEAIARMGVPTAIRRLD